MSQEEYFSLHVSLDELKKYYRGEASCIQVTCESGKNIRFPVVHLRNKIHSTGIHGRFRIEFDRHNKFISLEQLETDTSTGGSFPNHQPEPADPSEPRNKPGHFDFYG